MLVVGQLLSRLADSRFGRDVHDNLPRLFAEHSARIVRNDESEYSQPRSFDHAVATVSAPDVELRFVRVRGQFSIDIAVPDERPKWDALDSALLWFDMERGISARTNIPEWSYGFDWHSLDWSSVDNFLAENWDRIKAAASEKGIRR